jgi:hypothetical protein
LFVQFGPVTRVVAESSGKGSADVEFENPAASKAALDAGKVTVEGSELTVLEKFRVSRRNPGGSGGDRERTPRQPPQSPITDADGFSRQVKTRRQARSQRGSGAGGRGGAPPPKSG